MTNETFPNVRGWGVVFVVLVCFVTCPFRVSWFWFCQKPACQISAWSSTAKVLCTFTPNLMHKCGPSEAHAGQLDRSTHTVSVPCAILKHSTESGELSPKIDTGRPCLHHSPSSDVSPTHWRDASDVLSLGDSKPLYAASCAFASWRFLEVGAQSRHIAP